MKTKCLLWSVWVVAVLFVAVQPARCEKIEGIKNLRLICSSLSIVNGIEIYELTGGYKYTVQIKNTGRPYYEAKKKTLSDEQVQEVIDILNKYEIWKWDGFRESDPNVKGGNSFSFSLLMLDNKTISANGYEKYPENYEDVVQELLPILKRENEEEVKEVFYDPTTIEEIKSLSYYSLGGSTVTSGKYELTWYNGCNVKIKPNGQPAKIYLISDEQVKELIDLFNQYEVWKWNGFYEFDHDATDGSSFYFNLIVQDDKKINANGDKVYPQNYEKVVQEMLRIFDEGEEIGDETPVPITVEKIRNLSYSYTGSSEYGTADYELRRHHVEIVHWVDGNSEDPKVHSVSDEQMEELIDVLNKYEVWKWNGIYYYDPDVSDGASFSFALTVQDGITIVTDGYGIYPENFWEVIQELNRILDEGKELEKDNNNLEEDNEDNRILDEDDEEEEVSEEEGDNGVLVPIIIGAGVLVVVLVVIGVVRKRTARQAR